MTKKLTLWLVCVGTITFVISLAGFVFLYGNGASYLSNNPAACANCHIMQSTFESWRKSQHRHVATCNDCHVPHHAVLKWVVKGINGMHHSYAFTFQNPPAVLKAAFVSKKVVQSTCESCHKGLLEHTMLSADKSRDCIQCHQDVGHQHH